MPYLKSAVALSLLPELLAARSIPLVQRSVDCSFSTAASSGDSWASATSSAFTTPKKATTTTTSTTTAPAPAPTSGSPSTGTDNDTDAPFPTPAGIDKRCGKDHKVVSGDQCGTVESEYSISHTDFTEWNPSIDENYYICVHFRKWNPTINACRGNLWVDYYACVGV
ncbi:hypothetical protein BDW71DRAFT_215500 [Aspergillus fruticulosus]